MILVILKPIHVDSTFVDICGSFQQIRDHEPGSRRAGIPFVRIMGGLSKVAAPKATYTRIPHSGSKTRDKDDCGHQVLQDSCVFDEEARPCAADRIERH